MCMYVYTFKHHPMLVHMRAGGKDEERMTDTSTATLSYEFGHYKHAVISICINIGLMLRPTCKLRFQTRLFDSH